MKKIILSTLLACITLGSMAQVSLGYSNRNAKRYKDKNYYTVAGVEGALVQFADWQGPVFRDANGKAIDVKMIPRFSYFFNMGTDYNYQLDKNLSVFAGLNLRNVGLIMELDSIKRKHRVYTLGVPVGFRIHSKDRKTWFRLGVDFGWAVHYKLKWFIDNKKEDKFSEWFSDKTATFMPSAFAGLAIGKISLSTNIYLRNFFNEYSSYNYGYKANLVTVGLGINAMGQNRKFRMKRKSN
jgi:hypothetical protein